MPLIRNVVLLILLKYIGKPTYNNLVLLINTDMSPKKSSCFAGLTTKLKTKRKADLHDHKSPKREGVYFFSYAQEK